MCLSFLQMTSVLVKKVPMENGNSIFLGGGTIIFLALFGQRDILSWSIFKRQIKEENTISKMYP